MKSTASIIKKTVAGLYMQDLCKRKGWSKQHAVSLVTDYLASVGLSLHDFMEQQPATITEPSARKEKTMTLNPIAPTFAQDLAELMAGWNTIMDAAKSRYPNASPDELQVLASCAMNHALGIRPLSNETSDSVVPVQ